MATVHLPKNLATTADRMPRVCMVCGRTATQVISTTYSSHFVHLQRSRLQVGFDLGDWLMVLGAYLIFPILWVLSLGTRTRYVGLSPRCESHLEDPGHIELREVTPDTVVLEGVHENFTQAVKHLGRSRP